MKAVQSPSNQGIARPSFDASLDKRAEFKAQGLTDW